MTWCHLVILAGAQASAPERQATTGSRCRASRRREGNKRANTAKEKQLDAFPGAHVPKLINRLHAPGTRSVALVSIKLLDGQRPQGPAVAPLDRDVR